MEKFRIAFYGIVQVVALAYGILATGVVIKGAKNVLAGGEYAPHHASDVPVAQTIVLYHDYGIFLSLFIVAWAAFCAYHTFWPSNWYITERFIVGSGLAMSGLFFVSGTIFVFWATIGALLNY